MTLALDTYKEDYSLLRAAVVTTLAACALSAALSSRCLPMSKIDDGTVVMREDSTITIVIPDKR